MLDISLVRGSSSFTNHKIGMESAQTLPLELMLAIAERVEDKADLLSLMCTNQTMHECLEPLLYRRMVVHADVATSSFFSEFLREGSGRRRHPLSRHLRCIQVLDFRYPKSRLGASWDGTENIINKRFIPFLTDWAGFMVSLRELHWPFPGVHFNADAFWQKIVRMETL